MDQIKEPRRAWVYNAGRRRVTRAPNVAYDNPGTAADGQRTSDQFDMFNGAPDRYEWTLVGKREMLVPYNSYRLHSDKLKVSDILKPLHINQDLARYEREGYVFDTGPSLFTLPAVYRDLFLKTGTPLEDVVDLQPVDPAFGYRWSDGVHAVLPGAGPMKAAAALGD